MSEYSHEQLLDYLTVYTPKNPKKRMGKWGDGGYVIVDGYNYDLYLSCGIGPDVSFDKDFVKVHPNTKGYMFDGTLTSMPPQVGQLQIILENIGHENTEKTTNLESESSGFKDIFIKMDIETYEWKWMRHFTNFDGVKQLAVEVHGLFEECDKRGYGWAGSGAYDCTDMLEALKKIQETHYLVHLHSNSAANYQIVNGKTLPTVAELTYIRKRDSEVTGLNTTVLPTNLDVANYIGPIRPDLTLDYPPFCHPIQT